MANLNKVFLIGRLAADPELRHTQSDLAVTTFSVAVNRRFSSQGQQPTADFIEVVAWRQQAEFVTKYFKKGSAIFVSGSLQIRSWKDKDGNNRRSAEVVADEIQFVESKKDGAQSTADPAGAPSFSTGTPSDFEELAGEDDLPF